MVRKHKKKTETEIDNEGSMLILAFEGNEMFRTYAIGSNTREFAPSRHEQGEPQNQVNYYRQRGESCEILGQHLLSRGDIIIILGPGTAAQKGLEQTQTIDAAANEICQLFPNSTLICNMELAHRKLIERFGKEDPWRVAGQEPRKSNRVAKFIEAALICANFSHELKNYATSRKKNPIGWHVSALEW